MMLEGLFLHKAKLFNTGTRYCKYTAQMKMHLLCTPYLQIVVLL